MIDKALTTRRMARFLICCGGGLPPCVAMSVALVIGVACADLRLGAQQPAPTDYLVGPQDELQITVSVGPISRVVVRADLPPASVIPALTSAITEVVPGAAASYTFVAQSIDALLVTERLMAWMSGFFGVLSLLIASIGLLRRHVLHRDAPEDRDRRAHGARRGAALGRPCPIGPEHIRNEFLNFL